ncbi:MAG: metallophosphoesterase family protein, partial [Acutalibacteraceae bacterium]
VPLRAGGQTAPKTIVAMTVEQHTGISESFTFAVAEAKIVAKDIEIDDKAVISYTFTGDNADNAGFAEGTIAVTPSSASALNGNYEVYFADDNGILDGYESVFTSAVTGSTVTFKMGEGTMIPAAATKIVLFNSLITDKSLKNAISYYEIPAYKRITTGDVRRTFASVSDVHVNYDDNGYGASEKWTAALNFFNKNGMDYVIVSGDMTGTGTETEYQRYVNASLSSDYPFENIYEARGNHDSTQNENFLKYTSGSGEVRPYENSPYYYVLLDENGGAKDDLFIFMAQELSATGGTSTTDNFSDAQLDWVENLLKNYSGTNTNIFLVEHSMIRNFGPGDKYDGAYSEPMYFADQFSGNMRFKSLLTEYKEVIMMSGHTHLSLYEHYNYSDENGNAARMIHNGSTSQPRSYTASGTISYNSEGKTTETYGSEGYLVYVYDDYVCYIGCNLSEGKIIPSASYIIPLYSENRSDVASIDVTQMPDKTEYEEGEYFDPTGMVITATMSDGSRQIVKGWGISSVYKLTADDKSVTVNFGGCTAAVAISVKGEQTFEGLGTSDNPYLISSADDFNRLTDLFNESKSSSSKYGEGLYFRQTADIDMTGYSGYNGTAADGNNKKYFAGNY